MKSILIIGMGRFGRHLAKKFTELGNEVMIIDKNEERMAEIVPLVTNAQIGDCTKEEVLKSLGVSNFDICFVSIGNDFQSSLEVTSMLKELGSYHVVSKATSEIQAKFLLRNGADEVVYPEKDIAEKAAIKYSANHIFDYVPLTSEYSIVEIPPLDEWIGKTIAEASVRNKYHMSILATKEDKDIFPLPKANYIIKGTEHLIVASKNEVLIKLINKI